MKPEHGRAVAAEKLPIARGHALTGQDRLRAELIERIMCGGSVDLAAAGRGLGLPAIGMRWKLPICRRCSKTA